MKKRFRSILALLACALMIVPLLSAGAARAEESAGSILGKPFPDFTVTDTEGNTFTLSEALKDHEAVLINIWATWCGPCLNEFPALNEMYKKYGDKVAFIALSMDANDTVEKIAAYRAEHGIDIPMAREGDSRLSDYIFGDGIPRTVIVDRFGVAVHHRVGAFTGPGEVERLLNAFMGDGYTETAVQEKIPADSSTRVFPVSAERALRPEGEGCRKIVIRGENYPDDVVGFIVPGDSVRIRIEVAADDSISDMVYMDMVKMKYVEVVGLLDEDHGVFAYDQAMPDASAELPYIETGLYDSSLEIDEKAVGMFLFRNEEDVAGFVKELTENAGLGEFTWAYAEEEPKAENTLQSYVLHVLDQDRNPVEGVMVNFCTDTACVPKESDETGTITFTGEPFAYHVQIVEVPDGYSWDEEQEMYTAAEYGEWVLRVRKD